MNTVILPFVLGYLLDETAAFAAGEDATKVEAGFDSWLDDASPWLKQHPRIEAMLEHVANPVIEAALKGLQDEADLKAAILAMAAKNNGAASAALLALVKQAAPELQAVLGAA